MHAARKKDPFDSGKIANLDGLRGVAIALVLLYHVSRIGWPFLEELQRNGRHGVSLFFVVSGFLITTLFLREERARGAVQLLPFYVRRMLRLMPLYYVVLGLYVAAVQTGALSAAKRAMFFDRLPSFLTYMSNFNEDTTCPFFFSWSLAVEEQFYVAFALLFVVVPRRVLIALLVALVVVKTALLTIFVGEAWLSSLGTRIALSYREPILLGVLLGFALEVPRARVLARRALASPAMLLALGVVLVATLALARLEHQSSPGALALYVLMTLLVGGLALSPSLRVLGGPALSHVGAVSYGIYLLHMLVRGLAERLTTSPALQLLLMAMGATAAASIVFRWFEQPIVAWGRRRADASSRPIAGAVRPPVSLPRRAEYLS